MYTKYSFVSNVMSTVLHNYPACHIAFLWCLHVMSFLGILIFSYHGSSSAVIAIIP